MLISKVYKYLHTKKCTANYENISVTSFANLFVKCMQFLGHFLQNQPLISFPFLVNFLMYEIILSILLQTLICVRKKFRNSLI